MSTFLISWALLSLALSIHSISKIRKNAKECEFIVWWAFPFGAFVWEDLFVYGILQAVLAFTALLLGRPMLWPSLYLIFWAVRSIGETLYFFLQQFIVPRHHPHHIDHLFGFMRSIFGNISEQKCFIIMQIVMQSITVLSLAGLFLLHVAKI